MFCRAVETEWSKRARPLFYPLCPRLCVAGRSLFSFFFLCFYSTNVCRQRGCAWQGIPSAVGRFFFFFFSPSATLSAMRLLVRSPWSVRRLGVFSALFCAKREKKRDVPPICSASGRESRFGHSLVSWQRRDGDAQSSLGAIGCLWRPQSMLAPRVAAVPVPTFDSQTLPMSSARRPGFENGSHES